MNSVATYARFIRTEHLDNVITRQFELYCKEEIGFIKNLCSSGNEKAIEFLKERLENLLSAIENDRAIAHFDERIELFKNNALPDISQTVLGLEDVLLMVGLQKRILIEYIPQFTADVKTATEINKSLEGLYFHLQKNCYRVFHQIQEIKNRQLEESEHLYRDLFDNAHDLIHMAKPDGTVIYVNNAWSKTLGYTLQEIRGRSIYSLIAEEEREKFVQYRNDILAQKVQDKEVVLPLISHSGQNVIVEGFISPFFKDGKAQYTRGIFRDITHRFQNEGRLREMNDQLLEREETLSQLIRYAPDAIIVINAASHILLWNPKAEEVFGWTENEVKGKRISDVIVPEQFREAHDKGMDRYLATGETRVLNKTIEITALNKEGHEFYISLTVSNFKRGGENVFISFLRDISEARRNQIELERKKKELEASNKELEQYGWLTSHDLREPLRKILTYSDMILTRNYNLAPEVRTNAAKIHDAGKRMSSLIQSILLYASLTGEKEMYDTVDLNDIVADVINDLELNIQEHNAVIRYNKLPVIEAIPFQMRQLFQNLFSNSMKYRKTDESPVIDINSFLSDGIAEISIADNGIGFDSRDNDKAFQLFQRLHTDRNTDGTGIGLAICKKIIASHKGSIRAQSRPGQGATFIIQLPVHHEE